MFYPMFTQVLLTYGVYIFVALTRKKAVKNKELKLSYFKTFQSQGLPEKLIVGSRQIGNLFEIPVLFFAICIIIMSLNLSSTFTIITAWIFVSSRIVHAFVHLGSNSVPARFLSFIICLVSNLALWIYVAINT